MVKAEGLAIAFASSASHFFRIMSHFAFFSRHVVCPCDPQRSLFFLGTLAKQGGVSGIPMIPECASKCGFAPLARRSRSIGMDGAPRLIEGWWVRSDRKGQLRQEGSAPFSSFALELLALRQSVSRGQMTESDMRTQACRRANLYESATSADWWVHFNRKGGG